MLEAEWRRSGKMVARSRSTLDTLARAATARIEFPQAPGGGGARFELTGVAVDTAPGFGIGRASWRGRGEISGGAGSLKKKKERQRKAAKSRTTKGHGNSIRRGDRLTLAQNRHLWKPSACQARQDSLAVRS